jgi:hypothetical protein
MLTWDRSQLAYMTCEFQDLFVHARDAFHLMSSRTDNLAPILLPLPSYTGSPLPPPPSRTKEEFWSRKEFQTKIGTKICVTPDYFEDANGDILGPIYNAALSALLQSLWTTLALYHRHPDSWDTVDSEAAEFVHIRIQAAFPDVTRCEHNWKLRQFCIDHYSPWRRTFMARQLAAATMAATAIAAVPSTVPVATVPAIVVPGVSDTARKRLRSPSESDVDPGEHPAKHWSECHLEYSLNYICIFTSLTQKKHRAMCSQAQAMSCRAAVETSPST